MNTALKILAYASLFLGFIAALATENVYVFIAAFGSFLSLLISAKIVEACDLYISYTRPLKREYHARKAEEKKDVALAEQLEALKKEEEDLKKQLAEGNE